MLISDWSSDVCSSDLLLPLRRLRAEVRDPLGVYPLVYLGGHDVAAKRQYQAARKKHESHVVTFIGIGNRQSLYPKAGAPLLHPVTAQRCPNTTASRSAEHTSELQSLIRISYSV